MDIMDSFAKYNRKNTNFQYKNKKKNYNNKNDNEQKNGYNNRKSEHNDNNKFQNGENNNKTASERPFSRNSPQEEQPFNRNIGNRLLIQKNANSEVETTKSNFKNSIDFAQNNGRNLSETLKSINNIEKNHKNESMSNSNAVNVQNVFKSKPNQVQNSGEAAKETTPDPKLATDNTELEITNEIAKEDGEQEVVVNLADQIHHPLCCSWTFWHTVTGNAFKDCLLPVKEFDTVEDFWSLVNFMKAPTMLQIGSDFSLFKSGIKPMWEDKMNSNGGAVLATIKNEYALQVTDLLWLDTLLSMIDGKTYGEHFNQICGAVVSIRHKLQRISLWVSNRNDKQSIHEIERKFKAYLKESGNFNTRININFKPHVVEFL